MAERLTTEQRILLFHAPYTAAALLGHAALFYVVAWLSTGNPAWPAHLSSLAPEARGFLALMYALTSIVSIVVACLTAGQAADDIEDAERKRETRDG